MSVARLNGRSMAPMSKKRLSVTIDADLYRRLEALHLEDSKQSLMKGRRPRNWSQFVNNLLRQTLERVATP